MGYAATAERAFIEDRINLARTGAAEALYDLGLAYSVGQHGVDVDLVEAHKWFNLAAMSGLSFAQEDRAAIAAEMSRFEIAEAQRQARNWLDSTRH